MTEPMRVEPSELRSKASEIDTSWAPTPVDPNPPCGLDLATVAVKQIYAAAQGMRQYIAVGQSEAKRLSQSLNAAAEAYEAVDAAARAALENGQSIPDQPVTPNMKLSAPVAIPTSLPVASCPAPPGYLDVEQAAQQIAQPDQAATLETVAVGWNTYAGQLDVRAQSFELDSVHWEGTAAESAQDALRQHKEWLEDMADSSRTLASQARDLAFAHRKAVAAHPTLAEVEQVTAQLRAGVNVWEYERLMAKYKQLQAESEHVLAGYAAEATVGILEPPKPPSGAPNVPPIARNGDPRDRGAPYDEVSADSPAGPGTGRDTPGGGPAGGPPPAPPPVAPMAAPAAQPAAQPRSANPAGSPAGGGAPSGGGPPSGGGMPGGLPGARAGSGGVPKDGPQLPEGPSLRPASTGGGGAGASGGGAGGGPPSMPLSPAVGAETVAPTQAAAGRISPAGAAPVGGAGGMGGGMGPLAHGGHNQGKEKKRDPGLSPDETLYEEDRPWTEAVIGNRRRRDVQESKESK